jgi:hypothetical protein
MAGVSLLYAGAKPIRWIFLQTHCGQWKEHRYVRENMRYSPLKHILNIQNYLIHPCIACDVFDDSENLSVVPFAFSRHQNKGKGGFLGAFTTLDKQIIQK